MVTMWSVNTRPNPGLASSAARSSAGTGVGAGRSSNSMLWSPPLMARYLRKSRGLLENLPNVQDRGYGHITEIWDGLAFTRIPGKEASRGGWRRGTRQRRRGGRPAALQQPNGYLVGSPTTCR